MDTNGVRCHWMKSQRSLNQPCMRSLLSAAQALQKQGEHLAGPSAMIIEQPNALSSSDGDGVDGMIALDEKKQIPLWQNDDLHDPTAVLHDLSTSKKKNNQSFSFISMMNELPEFAEPTQPYQHNQIFSSTSPSLVSTPNENLLLRAISQTRKTSSDVDEKRRDAVNCPTIMTKRYPQPSLNKTNRDDPDGKKVSKGRNSLCFVGDLWKRRKLVKHQLRGNPCSLWSTHRTPPASSKGMQRPSSVRTSMTALILNSTNIMQHN